MRLTGVAVAGSDPNSRFWVSRRLAEDAEEGVERLDLLLGVPWLGVPWLRDPVLPVPFLAVPFMGGKLSSDPTAAEPLVAVPLVAVPLVVGPLVEGPLAAGILGWVVVAAGVSGGLLAVPFVSGLGVSAGSGATSLGGEAEERTLAFT